MIRAIIVIVTVLFLIGSFAYAEYGTENGLFGVMAEPEGENIDGGQNDPEGERSDVAEAVLSVLGEWESEESKSPEDDGRDFGETVADLAREGNLGEEVAEAARGANNNNNEEENNDANDNDNNNNVNGNEPERSEVADAVLGVLGDGASPGDGNEFGQNVADQAQDGGLGQDVSQAARGVNDSTSSNPGNKSNPASSQGRGSPPR